MLYQDAFNIPSANWLPFWFGLNVFYTQTREIVNYDKTSAVGYIYVDF